MKLYGPGEGFFHMIKLAFLCVLTKIEILKKILKFFAQKRCFFKFII